MPKKIEIEDKPVFITPQISMKKVDDYTLEISVGRNYYVVTSSESPIEVKTFWEGRDGPSKRMRDEYIKRHGDKAALEYENETGNAWDKDKGFIQPYRLILSGGHSILLPANHRVPVATATGYVKEPVHSLFEDTLAYFHLEGEDKGRFYKVEQVLEL